MGLVVKYGGSSILTVNSDAIFKLLTSGKMMSDDVRLEYTGIPIDETTAIASDVTAGKYFFDALGQKTLGTAPLILTKYATEDVTVSTTSTSASEIAWIGMPEAAWDDAVIIYVKIRDKAGPRNGYFIGSDSFLFNYNAANNSDSNYTSTASFLKACHRRASGGAFSTYLGTSNGYGIYPNYFLVNRTDHYSQLNCSRRYNSTNSLTINGTYRIEIYGFTPDSTGPFDFSAIT